MITWLAEVKHALGLATFTIPNVTIRSTYPTSKPQYPLIIIGENTTNNGVYVDAQPRIVTNLYQLEVYCKTMDISGTIYTSDEVSKILGVEVDTLLNTTFNFTQIGEPFGSPLVNDSSVYRWVIRYKAIIDQQQNKFFRGL